MAYVGPVHQWETFWVDLEPSVGSEQGGDRRPALVVSNDGFNTRANVVTVLPITKAEGKKRPVYPFEVHLPADAAGNPLDSIIMPQQIRTVSKLRLLDRIGSLTDAQLRYEIEEKILEHLGISLDDEEEL